MDTISYRLAEFLVSASYQKLVRIKPTYSGRGMYGKTVLGMAFDSIQAPFALFEEVNSLEISKELADFLAGCRLDSFGTGIILYSGRKAWPANVSLPDEDYL